MRALERAWVRWGFALAVTGLAAGANLMLQPMVEGRAPMLPFYPAILAVAFLAGVWPALASLAISAVLLAVSIGLSVPTWHAPRPADVSLLLAFVGSGTLAILLTDAASRLLKEHRKTREHLHLALAAGQMTTWEWNVTSGRVALAPGAEAVFGGRWSRMEEAWSHLHEADRQCAIDTAQAALKAGQTHYSFISRLVRPDNGETRWIETHGHVVRDARGRAQRVTGIAVDVDARQRALEASRAAEFRFEVALRNSGIVIWECDREMRYTWVRNPQLGFKPDDFVGRRMGDIVPREQAIDFYSAADRVLASGHPETLPVRMDFGGVVRHYLSTIDVMSTPGGEVVGLIGASLEITQLKAVEEALKCEVERKDTFLATLAHELRNPMAPIRYAAAMLAGRAPDATREQAQQVIERQSAHMAHLLDDLLDMSRISRNQITLQRTHIDLRSATVQATESARSEIARRGHRLNLSLPTEPVWIDGDTTRVLQIMGNLLDNAIKYTPHGGDIGVTLTRDGHHAVLSVRDNGVGLARESLASVFELFTRAGQRQQPDPGGLGIGLAVVKQLVELHGGGVEVASDGIGHGAEFIVRFPLVTEPQAEGSVGHEPRGAVVPLGRVCSVLVVDDNEDAADMLATALRLDGFAVSVAYDGSTALQALEDLRPSVVLLDLGLPDMSGYEVAERMSGVAHAPKLVALSGWGQERDRERARAAGFQVHLVKPVALDEVNHTIRALISPEGESVGAA